MDSSPSVSATEGSRVVKESGAGVLDDSVTSSDVTVSEVGDAVKNAREGVESFLEVAHGIRSTDGRKDEYGESDVLLVISFPMVVAVMLCLASNIINYPFRQSYAY